MSVSGEYIKLLSAVEEDEDPLHWFKGRNTRRDFLLVELSNAGFLRIELCEGAVEAYITYKGRLEFERLSQRVWWRRMIAWLGSAFLFVVGYIADVIRDVVVNICNTN